MVAKTSAAVTANNPAFDAYRLLRLAFIVAPFVMGLDKFFNRLTQWPKFLCPLIMNRVPPEAFMRATGVTEMAAGVLVLVRPKVGAYVVAAWLLLIIINLLLIPGYYDIVLRDVGLLLAALALARLSAVYSR
jgi:hypothetical protein